ncbi:MAG: aspartate--tRNA ligase [Thermoanaerobaculia bacterium]|nr:MAG: aspartate--tRNA ligase [Thermoanaerobaculia bacterium]
MKRTWAGTLGRPQIGERVLLQGWVQRRRDLGGLLFLDLRDRSGVAQAVVRPEDHPEIVATLAAVRAEWVIEVEGEVVARESVNPKMPTGEIEVVVTRAAVLAQSEALPYALDGHAEATEETRLRYRYLELRRPELQRNLILRHRVTQEARRFFDEQGFIEVETPILTKSTPEGARDYLVPSRVHAGEFYALPQSPQLFKQLLMIAGFERYVQIARCFRDEDLRADRQPEFTQIDLEMSFPTEETIYELIEGLFARIFPIVGVETKTPFRRMTYAEAMEKYGVDRPDLRFGAEIRDLTAAVRGSSFRVFEKTSSEGGVVRALVVPGGAATSRSKLDSWNELARKLGLPGLLHLKRSNGEAVFSVKEGLAAAERTHLAEALGVGDGDLALIAAGAAGVVAPALGALRLELARQLGWIPEQRWEFVWVTDFPLFEWHPEDGRWYSTHHPFTSPDPRDLDRLETDPGSVRARAYDVVLNGTELGGGSIRIHDPSLQSRAFRVLGIGEEEARRRFGFLLDALRFGAPPHGGLALGLDRMVMVMAGAASLRDVIAFPKTASATDLMTEAPSEVDPKQLEELAITLRRN